MAIILQQMAEFPPMFKFSAPIGLESLLMTTSFLGFSECSAFLAAQNHSKTPPAE